jgi:hypothetical protein
MLVCQKNKREEKMKRLLLSLSVVLFLSVSAFADEPQKFSPEKFQADMEQFITQEACLTPEEAAKFFPLLREMHKKQRAIQMQIKKECKIKPVDEVECKKCVQKRDVYELELKNIQQTYHNKFFCVLPASKVYDVIKAEDRFHRRAFKNWSQNKEHKDHQHKHQPKK